jgi:hypothetical protein
MPTDVHDPWILPVVVQQLFAERKEGEIRQAVILQQNRFLHLFKHPVQATDDALATAEIRAGVSTSQGQSGALTMARACWQSSGSSLWVGRGPSATTKSCRGRT